MTTTTTDAVTLEAQIEAFADGLFGAALGSLELTVAWLGRTLGLYAALRAESGLTAGELAGKAGIDARYVREWVEHQAVAQVVTVDDPAAPSERRRYVLPEAHAVVLLDEEHPAYAGALADLPPIIGRTLDALVAAFRTGAGVAFASYGVHAMQAGFTRAMFANSFVQDWLPALPDVQARLAGGEALRVADLGCGEGWAGIYLAEAYPSITVDGFDLDDASVAAARRHAAGRGVSDRVRFEVRDVSALEADRSYDLAFCCEVIHDLADPVGALAAMRRVTDGGGAVLVIDERAGDEFAPNGDPIERLLYCVSIIHCLPVGRDAETSAATGTVMRPATFEGYAADAGFSRVDILPIEHPMFRFYRPVS